jgi:Family of unknown function (DUF7002)
MNIQKFINLRPFLYHLTDKSNFNHIVKTKVLLSTKKIVEKSNIIEKKEFLRTRRPDHANIHYDDVKYKIRDQRPISIKALSKCLTNQWSSSDFIEHINKRVFFWCKLDRLLRHFERYQNENPKIMKCNTEDIFKNNITNIELCRINSGATRANSYLGGIAPPRGPNTFLKCDQYNLTPGTVVEVTIVEQCVLPGKIFVSNNPDGPWEEINLNHNNV